MPAVHLLQLDGTRHSCQCGSCLLAKVIDTSLPEQGKPENLGSIISMQPRGTVGLTWD